MSVAILTPLANPTKCASTGETLSDAIASVMVTFPRHLNRLRGMGLPWSRDSGCCRL